MISFRRKILLSPLVLFLIFVVLLFFAEKAVGNMILILLLYSFAVWIILHYLSQPIQQIIDAILPYQQGKEEFLPRIVLRSVGGDEFGKLASTLNSLTEQIQKQIENLIQQRKETEGVLESLGEGVVALDPSAQVTFVNAVACQMLVTSRERLIGQRLDHLQGLGSLCHELVLQALQTSESAAQIWREEGGSLFLDLIAAPLAQQAGAILVLQDKTSDHKVIEMGKNFIANASHELRTPITIIRGFAETLRDLPEIASTTRSEIIEKIVRTCIRLDKLVKSLLTLNDIENASLEKPLANCELVALAGNCKHLLSIAHPEAKVSLESDAPAISLRADADLLELAIMNLLENAVKYSSTPAQITVRIRKGKERVFLEVADRGIGIPQEDLPHIFDRFYTVDKARSRKSGGAGLGLSIVKTIMEKHQGSVSVRSKVGEGSTFVLSV